MVEANMKEVEFNEYCKKCKYDATDETDNPCNECLIYGMRENTKKPLYFEEKKG